jgi:hypothetical protein
MKIFLFFAFTIITGILSVIFFAVNENEPPITQKSIQQEASIPLNMIIGEAMTVYASAPYQRHTREDLQKYFSNEIVENILNIYEPFNLPDEEIFIEFEEQPFPKIEIINIQTEDGEYTVKLQFGEVFYNYRVRIAPNRIITNISEGGISFE